MFLIAYLIIEKDNDGEHIGGKSRDFKEDWQRQKYKKVLMTQISSRSFSNYIVRDNHSLSFFCVIQCDVNGSPGFFRRKIKNLIN
jgi:hypothetical protein